MKLTRLSRSWGSKRDGIVAQCDIAPTEHGRLFAKVLMFRTLRDLRRWCKKNLGGSGSDYSASVQGLFRWKESVGGDGRVIRRRISMLDRRYFCVMAFARTRLSMEVISHESVHAGFCYAKRVRRTPWKAARDFDEEHVAYPAGSIAAAINAWCHEHDFYWGNNRR